MLTANPMQGLWLSSALGFKLDRARHGVEDTARLSPSDRLALGASDSNAVLFGLALSQRLRALDLIAEWSWDLQVGGAAPAPLDSPMRIAAGARLYPASSLELQLLAWVSPSSRPELLADGPLYTIEPRFGLGAALGIYFPEKSAAARPPRAVQAPPAPAAPVVGAVDGQVVDAAGRAPLPAASIEVAGREPVLSDAQGRFTLVDLPPGEVELHASGGGFRPTTARANVVAGARTALEVALERELPEGQIRGTVRTFDGKPLLTAQVRVEPGSSLVKPDADGNFELDVAPGEYAVEISAPGYLPQQRPALVEHNGVTVIVVELGAEK